MNHPEKNPDYIPEPGQMRRFLSKSQHTRELVQTTHDENRIWEQMYMNILKELINKRMFTLHYMENMDGSISFEATLDIRTPLDYGTPKWESLEKKNKLK